VQVPPESNTNTYLSPTEPATASRRPSIPTIQEGIPHNHIKNEHEQKSYTPNVDKTPPSNGYPFASEQNHYSHSGNYAPFTRDGTFPPAGPSYAQSGLQYPPESNFPLSSSPSANIGMAGGMGSYAPPPADYSFAAPPANSAGHGQEHFSTYN